MKIELDKKKEIESVIKKSYFSDGNNGKLNGKDNQLKISKKEPLFIMLKGLNNMTIRVTNQDIIDGCMRFVVDESDQGVYLIPCSLYCIIENQKYSFY
jgi:hypothetical protein